MDLWIRSQDRLSLLKPFDLELMSCLKTPDSDYDTTDIRAYLSKSEDDYVILGTYNTRKRALEILDEISNKIKNQYIVKVNCLIKPSVYEIKPINPNVIYYEMPKE